MISTVLGFGSLLEISQNAPEKENENERGLTAGVSTKLTLVLSGSLLSQFKGEVKSTWLFCQGGVF